MKKQTVLFPWLMILLLILQLGTAAYFGAQKQGFHYDEYYSYYSSNVTYRLLPTDREWKDVDEIRSEFAVLPGGRFQYGMVTLMQTFDVHPPVYYLLLHTVCSLFPGSFSKWTGIGLNLFFFALCYILLARLALCLTGGDRRLTFMACLLFGFNPGIISGVTFIRMYMLLTVFLLLLTYLHAAAILQERLTFLRFYLPVMITVYLGFLTHYYFFVYLFMLAAAFACRLLADGAKAGPFRLTWKANLRRVFCYGCSIGLALALAVLSYPACLSHIFRGYRGTGAASAFFDLTNTGERLSFFFGLLNTYVFGGLLPFMLLALLLLLCTCRFFKSRLYQSNAPADAPITAAPAEAADRGQAGYAGDAQSVISALSADEQDKTADKRRKAAVWVVAFAVLGYFLIVAKTALLTAEEANRYEQPVYGLLLLLALLAFYETAGRLSTLYHLRRSHSKAPCRKSIPPLGTAAVLTLFLLCAELAGLASGKVLFLYQDDVKDYAFAKEHASDTVLYYYNNDLSWMIWDDSVELMQYDSIYFVNLADPSLVTDTRVDAAASLIVYAMRTDQTQTALQNLLRSNPHWSGLDKIGERLYCDIYRIQ